MINNQMRLLHEIFIKETREQLLDFEDKIVRLEKEPENMSIVSDLYRLAHSIKGASVMIGYEDFSRLTHRVEDVLEYIANYKKSVPEPIIDILYEAIDVLDQMRTDIQEGTYSSTHLEPILHKLSEAIPASVQRSSANKQEQGPFYMLISEFEAKVIEDSLKKNERVYLIHVDFLKHEFMKGAKALLITNHLKEICDIIRTNPEDVESALDSDISGGFELLVITMETEEDIRCTIKSVDEYESVALCEIFEDFRETGKNLAISSQVASKFDFRQNQRSEIRVDITKLNSLIEMLCDWVNIHGSLKRCSDGLQAEYSHLPHVSELYDTVEAMLPLEKNLKEVLVDIRVCSIENVFNRFPRMVRNLSKRSGKKIEFDMQGNTMKMDKAIIELIVDPIVHLLRNAIDHGIESPQQRRAAGKPECGWIMLKAEQVDGNVKIEIEDDGKGIDLAAVRKKAVEKGLLMEGQETGTDEKAVLEYIFSAGISTAPIVTDISGRGVGMDIVKNNVEKLGGCIQVHTVQGVGTRMEMIIPTQFSLSLFRDK